MKASPGLPARSLGDLDDGSLRAVVAAWGTSARSGIRASEVSSGRIYRMMPGTLEFIGSSQLLQIRARRAMPRAARNTTDVAQPLFPFFSQGLHRPPVCAAVEASTDVPHKRQATRFGS